MRLSYHKLKIPLISPFTTSFGTDVNNRTAALVGIDGTVDWACFPNFNSNPVF